MSTFGQVRFWTDGPPEAIEAFPRDYGQGVLLFHFLPKNIYGGTRHTFFVMKETGPPRCFVFTLDAVLCLVVDTALLPLTIPQALYEGCP